MTGNRMIARFCKGRGWTYNVGGEDRLGPETTKDLLRVVYGLGFHEVREKMLAARNGAVVSLPEPRRPAREEVSA